MTHYIVRRLLSMLPVLLIVSMIAFALLYVLPGAAQLRGAWQKNMTPYDERTHREQLGLPSATDQTSSTPGRRCLELVDLVDSQIDLVEDPPLNDDL